MTENEIRKLVENRKNEIDVIIDIYTPSGRERSLPMYTATIQNEYLNKSKQIKTTDKANLERRVQELVTKWSEEEIRKRIREQKSLTEAATKKLAAEMDVDAKEVIDSLKLILEATLSVDDTIDWEKEYDTSKFKRFSPQTKRPTQPVIHKRQQPVLSFWGHLFPWVRKKHLKECKNNEEIHASNIEHAHARYQKLTKEYEAKIKQEKEEHARQKEEFLKKQESSNKAIGVFRMRFESGEDKAIEEYCDRVLSRSQYPDSIKIEAQTHYDTVSKVIEVKLNLPSIEQFPEHTGFKYVKSGNKISPIKMKAKEAKTLYSDVIDQIVLRTACLLYTSPSPRDATLSRMPSSA